MKASELDKIFDEGKEDILQYFDLSKARMVNVEQKRVNVDFPQWMVNELDAEAKRLGVPRQSIIKMWIGEKLEAISEKRLSNRLIAEDKEPYSPESGS